MSLVLEYTIKGLGSIIDRLAGGSRLYSMYITKPKPVILEAATGFGANLGIVLRFATRLGGIVYSVDIGGPQVSLARIAYRSYIEKGVLVIERGDLRNLHYPNDFFDYAINHTTMHHIDRVDLAISEHWRTLKSNGILIVIDLNPHTLTRAIHSLKLLRESKENVINETNKRFRILERGEDKLSYYIIAVKET
ncbi:MAG: class I SAM-dependent methyltransferase [Acidilobaceae archaeon]